jgi:predicted Rossmann-fold nucleotide-binding protein
VVVIGATSPTEGYQDSNGIELGKHLGNWFKLNANKGYHLFTGGVEGVGLDVYRGLIDSDRNGDDIFSVLIPQSYSPNNYDKYSPNGKVTRDIIGENMEQRRVGLGFVADVLVAMNGGPGTMHEAITGLKNGRKVIALPYGGVGQTLYDAKETGVISDALRKEGLNEDFLKLIIPSTMEQFEGVLQAVSEDRAQLGGIDLTSANLSLQTRNSGGEIKFHVDPAMLQQLQNAPGFVPVIINIQPMTNLRLWLGLNDNKPADELARI